MYQFVPYANADATLYRYFSQHRLYCRKYNDMLTTGFDRGYNILHNLFASAKLQKEIEEENRKHAEEVKRLGEQADKDRKLYKENMTRLQNRFDEETEKRAKELKVLQQQLNNIKIKGSKGCIIS